MFTVYSIYILCFLIIFLVFLLIKQLQINFNTLATIFLTIIIIYFIISPNECISSALQGAKLFANSILPSLFPFMVICNMLIAFDGIKIYSKIIGPILCKPLRLSKCSSFAIVASFLCGYPLGAKYSADLYKKKYISKDEFSRLLNIASNAGPLFIIGAIGSSMLNNPYFGYIILISNYLSAIIIGFLTIKKGSIINSDLEIALDDEKDKKNIGEILKDSISDAVLGVLTIGGYVIFFSLLISVIKNNPLSKSLLSSTSQNSEIFTGFILGSLDLSNGSSIVATGNLNLIIKLCLLSFICSFGSISVVAQVNSFIYKYKISMAKYTLYKFLQGIISIIICYILCFFTLNSLTVFNNMTLNIPSYYYLIPTLIILIISFITIGIYKLLDFS